MSDLFTNFDSNGAFGIDGDSSQDTQYSHMASSQGTPMTNQNSGGNNSNNNNTSSQNGGASNSSSLGGSGVGNTNKPSGGGPSNNADNQPLLTKPRLMELVREVDTSAQLDEDVEELLMQMVDDFVDDAVKTTSAFAKHRKGSKVEVRDVQLHLERKYNMWIPGFGTDELRPYKRAAVTEAHKQRLALIRKTIKKY